MRKMVKRLRVDVTRDNPRYSNAYWNLYAEGYRNMKLAREACNRAVTTGEHPYRAARITRSIIYEGLAR